MKKRWLLFVMLCSSCATLESANNPKMLEHLAIETGCDDVRVTQYAPPRLRAEGCDKRWACRLDDGAGGSEMMRAATRGWICEEK
jgi:hypothetical protein